MRLTSLLVVPLLLVGACSGNGSATSDKPVIVAAVYPLQWLAEQITDGAADVEGLVEPGVEPHDVELTPKQVAEIKSASVVLYLKGFQPAVDDAVAGLHNAFDLSAAVDTLRASDGTVDPHVWLDPVRMKAIAVEIASILGDTIAWEGASYGPGTFSSADVGARLEALDRDVRGQLQSCRTREVVTSHAAFAYLADRYGLVQRGIAGLSPESEPTPRDLADAVRFAREHHVTTIFFESLVSPKVAQTVAEEVGAKTAVLDPLESVQGSDDYLTVMRRNAQALHEALGCA